MPNLDGDPLAGGDGGPQSSKSMPDLSGEGEVPDAALGNGVGVGEYVVVYGFGVEFSGGDDEGAGYVDNLEFRGPEVGVFANEGLQGVGGE